MKIGEALLNCAASLHREVIITGGSLVTLSLADVVLRCLRTMPVSIPASISYSPPRLLGDMPTKKVLLQTGALILGIQALHFLKEKYQINPNSFDNMRERLSGLNLNSCNLSYIQEMNLSLYDNFVAQPAKLLANSIFTVYCLEAIRRGVSHIPYAANLGTKVMTYSPELTTRVLKFLNTTTNKKLLAVIVICTVAHYIIDLLQNHFGINSEQNTLLNQITGIQSINRINRKKKNTSKKS